MDQTTMKRCSSCDQVLPQDAFAKDSNRKDLCQPYCRECRKRKEKEKELWSVGNYEELKREKQHLYYLARKARAAGVNIEDVKATRRVRRSAQQILEELDAPDIINTPAQHEPKPITKKTLAPVIIPVSKISRTVEKAAVGKVITRIKKGVIPIPDHCEVCGKPFKTARRYYRFIEPVEQPFMFLFVCRSCQSLKLVLGEDHTRILRDRNYAMLQYTPVYSKRPRGLKMPSGALRIVSSGKIWH